MYAFRLTECTADAFRKTVQLKLSNLTYTNKVKQILTEWPRASVADADDGPGAGDGSSVAGAGTAVGAGDSVGSGLGLGLGVGVGIGVVVGLGAERRNSSIFCKTSGSTEQRIHNSLLANM